MSSVQIRSVDELALLRTNFAKFLIGILIGEGTVYAIYVYVGDWMLRA